MSHAGYVCKHQKANPAIAWHNIYALTNKRHTVDPFEFPLVVRRGSDTVGQWGCRLGPALPAAAHVHGERLGRNNRQEARPRAIGILTDQKLVHFYHHEGLIGLVENVRHFQK
jgi:hypothetical protein